MSSTNFANTPYTKFLFYFETEESYITKNENIIALESFEKITINICSILGLSYQDLEIRTIPVEDGCIKLWITLASFLGGAIFGGSISDYSAGFIKGLTGKPLETYGEEHAQLLSDCVAEFYKKPNKELDKIIPTEINLDKARKNKSNFFSMIYKSKNINGINFNAEKEDIIRKKDFILHILGDIERDLEPIYKYMTLQIIKPVLNGGHAKWGFINEYDKTPINCYIEDKLFLTGVLNGEEIPLAANIVEVYTFNHKSILNKPVDFDDKNIVLKKKGKHQNAHSTRYTNSLLDFLKFENE